MFEFQNSPIPKDQEDKHLSDRLFEERDGIFAWAVEGLAYYIGNGENFPTAQKSMELKYRNMARYCPEQTFCDQYVQPCEGAYLSTKELLSAFDEFKAKKNFSVQKKLGILYYLENQFGVRREKKRVAANDGWHNIHGYKNLCLVCPDDETENAV